MAAGHPVRPLWKTGADTTHAPGLAQRKKPRKSAKNPGMKQKSGPEGPLYPSQERRSMRNDRVGVALIVSAWRLGWHRLLIPYNRDERTYQCLPQHLIDRLHGNDLQRRFHIIGDLGQILLILIRDEHGLDARP